MPSKGRWALNPRKWFGTSTHAAHKSDKKPHINDSVAQFPSKLIRTNPTTTIGPRIFALKNKTKVTPTSPMNGNNYTNYTHTLAPFTQYQLPSFAACREKTSVLLTSKSSKILFNRTNTLIPTRTEPSIRKNNQYTEQLTINATQWNTATNIDDTSKDLISPSLLSQYENSPLQQNPSEQCLIDCQQDSLNNFIDKCISPTRSRSSSSIDDNDEHDESSSSGIFTDERADLPDRHRTASKDTLSMVEVLSIESIADSQISLNHHQSRPLAHRYRSPVSTFETVNNKSPQSQRQTTSARPYRVRSAENILKDNQTTTPITTKSRQSSAAIAKKIEKRIPTGRSPPITLEKAGFVRIANAKYRLTTDKNDHLYHHHHHQNSFIQCSNCDDSLPPANDEELYATLPRTSSTEQLNTNIHNDLRAIVDDCLRPIINSINKPTHRSIKTQHRSKRSHKNNHHEHIQIDIEDITDKLLSSIDCSTYVQYQRCY